MTSRSVSGFGRWAWAAAGLLLASVAALLWVHISRARQPSPPSPFPLTSFEGFEVEPALSPDGEKVAFTWDGGTGGPHQLYLQEIGSAEPVAITSGSVEASRPVWSPDGREIAFFRRIQGGDSELLVVAATGGSERRLTTVTDVHFLGVDWSPDGRHLVLVDKEAPEGEESIFLFSIEDGVKRRLSTPPSAGSGDRGPAFSRDGKTVAFVRWREAPRSEVYLTDVETGRLRRLTLFDGFVRGMAWLPDDSAIILSAEWRGTSGLWRLPLEGGEPARLTFGENARGVSLSRSGRRLAYARQGLDSNIWRVSGPGAPEPSPPTRLIASTRRDMEPQYSPDGRKIAFASDRSGELQIWLCESDGTDCGQLTPQGAWTTVPRWSPDGESIAFAEMSRGNADVYVIDLKVGIPFRLTREESSDAAWCWSSDSRWVYFMSDRTGDYQIWRVPVSGGEAEQVTKDGGTLCETSPDGRTLYFVKLTTPRSVWRLDLETGQESFLFERDLAEGGFTVWRNLILFLQQEGAKGAWVEAFDMETGRFVPIADLGSQTRLTGFGRHSVSPDGRWIIYTQEDGGGSDIMLVEHFF